MRVGVIGGGQLAWMMATAARSLHLQLIVQTPKPDDPAVGIADDVILAAIDDAQATAALSDRCDVITFENEFVDLEGLRSIAQTGVQFFPQLSVLEPLLDKYDQRQFFQTIGSPVPRFAAIELTDSAALSQFGFPVVLKARRHGYDGQGTFILRSPDAAFPNLKQPLLEEFVPFERELAVMVARSQQGEIVTYPVVETQQHDQVCRRVLVTNDLSIEIQQAVEAIARQFVTSLQAVGIFGIELFLTSDHQVLVNEVAPRTHNSGHFSIEACETSQFEQQLRAVCGLPLGSTAMKSAGAVMVNLLGYESSRSNYADVRDRLAERPQTFVHWYGKESRPGRKLGHVTVLLGSGDRAQAIEQAEAIEAIWYPD
ncbi:5-(carboxyamino)imidazole ribonucleotide synthase [Microcoleus sp. FACHB-1515]|uniref:5-(carboxyamino)imidazole ribonucleotide synthase n=1 Tax=Cyanophyceae TaxID=3028117 RepID=UPI0018F02ACD|nr:5-(carboxyamino)imidazole ribonucleotide synthase [Microcoleus sp. FACHB-1515]